MAFHEYLFPPRISANMEVELRHLMRPVWTIGGQRFGNLDDPAPVRIFTMAHPVRNGADFEELRAFVMATQGGRLPFRIDDKSDDRATLQNTLATLISGSTYQMNRIYVSNGVTRYRPLYKLATGFAIYRIRSGTPTDITGSTTLNLNNGQLIVTGHSNGDTYHGLGIFHTPAAFENPSAVWRVIGTSQMYTEWSDIVIRETREIA